MIKVFAKVKLMMGIVFATCAATHATQRETLLLLRSIRRFGGAYAHNRVIVAVPESAMLNGRIATEVDALNVEFVSFQIDDTVLNFPFAMKVLAAGAVEDYLQSSSDTVLAWMDSDCLVLQPPETFLLHEGVKLAYRPVDHTLIGSRCNQPVDDFWGHIYAHFGIDEDSLSTMITTVDEMQIRPYFNAGLLLVRSSAGILRRWASEFLTLYNDPRFGPFYEANQLYRIFMHQAVLAGTVLAMLSPDEMIQLPYRVHYPLHMHNQYPLGRRVDSMNDLITCRTDTFFKDANWRDAITIDPPLSNWLEQHIPSGL